ncbi:MAG: radical SAM protein [Megasphaera sp.]|jgi:7-carboxy-7-deazaguanine synthase|nr:radical SAM protein [Megasphaera sp.]
MKNKLNVNEIFDSIDGEGKRTGELATFIRLTGCNLRCAYCDTTYAFHEGHEMSVHDIAEKVTYQRVTVTGGEPLCQDIHGLLQTLEGHDINIETNGSIDITPYMKYDHVFFTIDYKCSSSGMSQAMLKENFTRLRQRDVLKFVVGSTADLQEAKHLTEKLQPHCAIYVSPVFGAIRPAQIVDFMKEYAMINWKIQVQLHKVIWDPEARGV